jgi:hypothetical protein
MQGTSIETHHLLFCLHSVAPSSGMYKNKHYISALQSSGSQTSTCMGITGTVYSITDCQIPPPESLTHLVCGGT